MTHKKIKDPKQRILDASTILFAQKGYSAIGVREIAAEANVNIAMISYYFDGKVGILKEIIEDFHERYLKIIEEAYDEQKSPEQCIRTIIQNIISFVRKHKELTLAAFNAMQLDIPEIEHVKTERIVRLVKSLGWLIERFGLDPNDPIPISIIGPSLLSSILAHFRVKAVQKNVFRFKFDDAFYKRYTEIMTTLFLYGINGIAEKHGKEPGGQR
ncbi:MAG: TetR family transcriptional regulator [Candidatus Aminicenantes bacterium]|jgi:AcrR family transcriptional regulator